MLENMRRYAGYGKTLVLYLYLQVLQALNRMVVGVGKRKYEIRYALHDRVYRIRTSHRRGPPSLIAARDQSSTDITDNILSYLGPNHDFHGNPMSPHDLGYEKIHLVFRDGRDVCIEGDCKIHLDELLQKKNE